MEKLGSFEYTRDILKKLDGQARKEVILFIRNTVGQYVITLYFQVANLGPNEHMENLLDELLNWKIK